MDMNAGAPAQEAKVFFQPLIILLALNQRSSLQVERLDADLQLQRPSRKLGNDFTQGFRQPVRHHLEMKKVPGLITIQEKFKDALARIDVQVESSVHELELFYAPV